MRLIQTTWRKTMEKNNSKKIIIGGSDSTGADSC